MMPPHRVYVETHLGGGAVFRHKLPAERSIGIDADPAVVEAWSGLGRTDIEVRLGDAAAFLREHRFEGDELVYCDPPYVPETRRRKRVYRHDYTLDQHRELLDAVRGLSCAVIVSGYRSELYDGTLSGWISEEFLGDSHVGPTVEVVWRNFDVPELLHDYSHIGPDFRAREGIRRRRESISRRIEALPDVERRALFRHLVDRHGPELGGALAFPGRRP